jgi:hypothetical protein
LEKNEVSQNQEVSSTFSQFAAKGTRNSKEKLPDLARKSISPKPRVQRGETKRKNMVSQMFLMAAEFYHYL